MRIASFNVENLFSRARAMNLEDESEGRPVLKEFSTINALIAEPVYTAAIKRDILASLERIGLLKSDENKFAILRQNRGRLLSRPRNAEPRVVATGRGSWIGWVELKDEPVDEVATQMTAKVIHDVDADVLAVIEAEDRIALSRFNEQLLRPLGNQYSGIMLIDGNDERGIDVGLFTKPAHPVVSIVSHVDDRLGGNRIFSRDCPEYTVRIGPSQTMVVMINHLKSKGYGVPAQSNARRKAQASRIREIYDQRRAEGIDLIAIVGDMNDTPDSDPMSPLLGNGSDLKDITEHPTFTSDGRAGTYKHGAKSQKIDYVLLSPDLFSKVTGGLIFRMGVWGGVNGTLFPHYPEITEVVHAASDHAAIYADIAV